MATLPVVVGSALLVALPLTLLVGGIVLLLYQRALLRWMQREPAPSLSAAGAGPDASNTRPAGEHRQALPSLAALRVLERRHWAWLAGLWLLIGLTAALFYLPVHGHAISPFKVVAVGMVWAAPGWLQLGLMARLPWRRGLAMVLAGFAGLFVVIVPLLVDTSEQALLQLVRWLLSSGLAPLLALTLLVGIPSLRAIAPLLYPQVAVATALALGGLGLLLRLYQAGASPLLLQLGLPPVALLLLAAGLPVVAGLGALHALSRAISAAHRRGWISDHSYSLAAGALLVLLFAVVPGWEATGTAGLLPLLAWLWVPLAITWLQPRLNAPPTAPGTPLLVLRLFRRPGPVGWLFDQVVQRWRFVGPVLLITASDLAARTLDADELVQFLEGRLGERFIAAPDQLPPQAAAPDRDGRFRVQEFCCYDSSWRMVLELLLQRSQVVLMDLRGFGPAHRGCLHELGRLGASAHLQRVVLLADASTDRARAAEAVAAGGTVLATGQAPPLVWVEERRRRHPTMEAVLAALTDQTLACPLPGRQL